MVSFCLTDAHLSKECVANTPINIKAGFYIVAVATM